MAHAKLGGSYSRVANAVGSSQAAVGRRLRSMGLPNLTAAHRTGFEVAAREFFVNGLSLPESASRGAVSVGYLEELVRTVGTNFIQAARQGLIQHLFT